MIWRVADTEAGALGAAYRVADPTALVRAIATRVLTAAFQQRTLTMVITGDREALAAGVRSQVQAELDALDHQFKQALGFDYRLIDSREYQVRRYPTAGVAP